jgi:hypothetical protein
MRHLFVLVAGALAAVAFAVPATAGGVERVPIGCAAEWNPATGTTSIYLFAPDTPNVPIGVSGELPFTGAQGEGTFAPTGGMHVVCTSAGPPSGIPPWSGQWNGAGTCLLLRGGNPVNAIGARVYEGQGRVLVSPSGTVLITCNGAFAGIYTP